MSKQYPNLEIALPTGKALYFASDFHLGAPNDAQSREREQYLCAWMEQISADAAAVFLVGDLFDFWFEYRHVVPKGFVRFLAGIAALRDKGIPVYVFTGNHDIWMFDYLEQELGVTIFREPRIFLCAGKKLFVGHGDGLGPGDRKFKILKKIFTFPFFQWLFRWLHPDIGVAVAKKWSEHSRTDPAVEKFHGEEREWLFQYANKKALESPADYFIFGHRHLALELPIAGTNSTYINLGEWFIHRTYLRFDGTGVKLERFQSPSS